MDSTFGIAGMDWVLIVSDTAVNRSIFTLKHDEDKILQLNKYKMVGLSGDQSNRALFGKFIQANLALKEFSTGHELGVDATA